MAAAAAVTNDARLAYVPACLKLLDQRRVGFARKDESPMQQAIECARDTSSSKARHWQTNSKQQNDRGRFALGVAVVCQLGDGSADGAQRARCAAGQSEAAH